MTRPSETWLPSPRPPLDDELAAERAVAARQTVTDRRDHEAVCAALAAVARCEATS